LATQQAGRREKPFSESVPTGSKEVEERKRVAES